MTAPLSAPATATASAPEPRPAAASSLAGTRELARLASRRDRIVLPVWIYALVGFSASASYSIKSLYSTEASRAGLAAGIDAAPAAAAVYGKLLGDDLGAITAWRVSVVGAVLAAVMSILLVVRHTRAEEQSGRHELLAAGSVGRDAAQAAALQLAIGADLVAGALIGAVLTVFGMPAAGSFVLGLAVAGCGLVFGCAAAVCAHLFESSRAANGAALAVLGLCYLGRAAVDMGAPGWLMWLSPVGWIEQARPYTGDHWWVLALPLPVGAALIAGAVSLSGRRDYGSGLIPPRPGPRYAAATSRGVTGLAWRLHRGLLFGWTLGMLIGGALFGLFAKDVTALSTSPRVQDILTRGGGSANLVDAYIVEVMAFCGLIAGGFVLGVVVRARAEESAGRAEAALAAAVGRTRWLLSHLGFAAAGSAVLLLAAGLGGGLSDGLRTHDVSGGLRTMLEAALVQWPAVFVMAAVGAAVFALRPAWLGLAWAVFGFFLFLSLVGPELKLSQPIVDLSPFSQVPKYPGGVGAGGAVVPLLWLTAVGLAVTVLALIGFRRRDLG